MSLNTFWYSCRQGMKNVAHNLLFSLASIATISACIFLFCLFFALMMNVRNVAQQAATTVGITVFFKEGSTQAQIDELGVQMRAQADIKSLNFVSAEQAWNDFKRDYFGENEELAEAFAEDNPLANSASYEVFLQHIEAQPVFVAWLKEQPLVRQVNYSNSAVSGLSSLNRLIGLLSVVIIAVLLAVAVFLISNTISVAAAFRRRENEIMVLIGATNFMIRLPFVVEGVFLGLVGALIPLGGIFLLYEKMSVYMLEHFTALSSLFTPLPLALLFPRMLAAALGLGVGIGFVVSHLTIRRQLRV